MPRVMVSPDEMPAKERAAYDERQQLRATRRAAKRRNDRAHAWPAWASLPCPGCGAEIGQHCRVIQEDLRLGYRRDRIGTTRKRVHGVRWEAYLIAAGPEGRRELAAAQNRKAERLRTWPHV